MLHSVILPRLKEKEVPKEKFNYLSAIGSLLYLSGCTRPDISAATGILARHGATPGAIHVKAVKRLIQYVYNTRKYGIQYRRDNDCPADTPKIHGQGRHPKDNGNNHMKNIHRQRLRSRRIETEYTRNNYVYEWRTNSLVISAWENYMSQHL